MRVTLAWAGQQLDLEIGEQNLVTAHRAPLTANLPDPVQAMREALEHPLNYPALRLALTPEDHVAIAIDERIPHLAQLIVPLLEHILQAHVQPDAITLLCSAPSTEQPWLDE